MSLGSLSMGQMSVQHDKIQHLLCLVELTICDCQRQLSCLLKLKIAGKQPMLNFANLGSVAGLFFGVLLSEMGAAVVCDVFPISFVLAMHHVALSIIELRVFCVFAREATLRMHDLAELLHNPMIETSFAFRRHRTLRSDLRQVDHLFRVD